MKHHKKPFPTFDEFTNWVREYKNYFDIYDYFLSIHLRNEQSTSESNTFPPLGSFVFGYTHNGKEQISGELCAIRIKTPKGYTVDVEEIKIPPTIDVNITIDKINNMDVLTDNEKNILISALKNENIQ
jgi:hypothetical protein